MVKRLRCDCGVVVSADGEEQLLAAARNHGITVHHIELSDETLRAAWPEVFGIEITVAEHGNAPLPG
ncbi:MAG TPA: hypothetical protein VNE62_07365 [Actinomycetota bacterium]|nr:hypothetical protein [Actinomycetota bacterium]